VPFFFDGPAAVIEGRGERVSPVRLSRPYVIVLVKPPVDVSTAWAYAQLDAVSGRSVLTKERNNIKLFCHALETGDFSLLSSLQRNDLEPSVLKRYPVVGEIKRMLAIQGALFSAMSGSGSAVFGLFRTEEEAVKAREALSPHWCRVVRTITDDERD
jgi:4-diphosphocytidyl-2-C-methyl-D-erythritol kinase